MSRRALGASFFHTGKAFSAASTAASTSASPARSTSFATREPSLGLKSSSFLEFLEATNCGAVSANPFEDPRDLLHC